MSTLFLFGAGASFGSGPCHPNNPPLGWDLFAELRKRPGVAATASEELAAVFAKDFEEGMDQFLHTRNVDASALLRDMAAYFATFEPLDGNLYFEIIKLVGGDRKKAIFATANYDLLFELAVCASGLTVSYTTDVDRGSIPVLKIHGSCNFLPPRDLDIRGIGFVQPPEATAAIVDAPAYVATSTRQVLEFCESGTALAPAIALYHSSKRVLYCPDIVRRQQEQFLASISAASRIFVIGLRVHPSDSHIWTPLARAKAPLYYVGKKVDLDRWKEEGQKHNAFWLAETFENAIPKIRALLP